jgi:hypothetical protein
MTLRRRMRRRMRRRTGKLAVTRCRRCRRTRSRRRMMFGVRREEG